MEFRRKDHEETSAFSRPLLPLSSSLLPNRPKPTEAGNGIISASSGDGGIGDGNQNAADSSSPTAAAAAVAAAATIRYRECLRNHAASLGGHVLDGCCEFMPGGASGDEALKCAACGCHRSFHRKESPDGGNLTLNNSNSSSFYHGRVVPNGSPNNVPLLLPPPHPHHHSITPQILPHRHPQKHQHQNQMIPPGFAGFASNSGGGTTTESSSEERQLGPAGAAPPHHRQFGSGGAPRKRFRTKFTPEQKDKLLGFAERVGWRIQKQDDAAVEAFCGEAGVSRQVLKVWMHNNKHTLRKQQQPTPQLYQQQQQQHHQEVVHQEAEEDVCED